MSKLEVFVPGGTEKVQDESEFLARLDQLTHDINEPFAETSLKMLATLSKRLLKSELGQSEPQLVALGFWLRAAALQELKVLAERSSCHDVRVARGLAYQLPPTNVDTLFVYSWAISYLVGNSNITRLPTSMGPTVTWLVNVLVECLKENGESHRQIFCTFDHSSQYSESISARSDLRVIWGGDAKVKAVSEHPTRPDGLSIGFPDRKSICVIDGTAYENLTDSAKSKLADQFFNDVFWFDQMGCGSPRVLVWRQPKERDNHDFLARLSDAAQARRHDIPTGVDIAKFVFANVALSNSVAQKATRISHTVTTLTAPMSSHLLSEVQGGGSLFETFVTQLADIQPLIRRDLQTITTFGLTHEEKLELAHLLGGRGGYRIVPIGEALQFGHTWDGIRLIDHFSRLIVVR